MLDADNVSLRGEERTNHSTSSESLLDIEVTRWLIEHVDIGLLNASHTDDKSLQFSARQLSNFSFQNVGQVEHLNGLIERITLVTCLQSRGDAHLGGLGVLRDRVDVLDLNEGFHLVLEHLLEEILQLTTSEEPEDFLPVRRAIESTEVRFHVT